MSRLIVKNIAKGVTPEKLREVFGAKGNVTDVQLKYSADGKFRYFGFVGFQKEEDALEALKDLDNTCIKGVQIKVEQCLPLGDPNKPRAWSKYSSDSSAYKKIHQQEEGKKQDDKKDKEEKKNSVVGDVMKKYENDPAFSDFLEARTKGKKIWSNDYIADDEQGQKGNKKNKSSTPESERSSGNDKNNENDRNRDDNSSVDENDSDDQNENAKVAKAAISDMEYLKMKTKLRKNLEDQKPIVAEDILPAKKIKKKKKKRKMKAEYYILLLSGLNPDSKTNNIKQFFRPLKVCDVRFRGIRKRMAFVDFASEKEMKLALKKNKSFLDGYRISVKLHNEYKQHSEKSQNSNMQWEAQSESLKNEESIDESGRLFVRNLPYTATETGLETLFSKYGPLSEVNMPIDNFSRKPKGFAIITFLMPEHAVKAYMELDGSIFEGRMLHLLPGKAKKTIEEMLEMEGLSYKEKKTLKMKAQANASINWNTLFLGQNAVADLIAKNYNTTKDKVLDARGNESLAVRLALGETEIVNETRKFLLDKGVHLDAFNQPTTQRSKTVILVKNLPAETTVSEIYELFAKFGELGRVLLPESGVTAIVEFLEPSEARNAFRKLAYSKFKYIPLYLEWAPENTFSTAFVRKTTPKLSKVDAVSKGDGTTIDHQHAEEEQIEVGRALSSVKEEEEEEESEEEEEAAEPDTTLFIKNLCYSTTEDAIKEHFQKCSPIHNVTIVRKKDPKNPGKFIPMGYGFIQFKRKDSLEKALKSYQNSVLDGFSLELKRSNRTLQSDVVAARKPTKIGKQTGSKILVRNIPFQATLREVRELFKTFGEIKFLRLPRKMAGTGYHRGFGFVEYYTRHEAKRALKALSQSTHLYGRRLVLEWANADEDVDELRRKTAHLFNNIPSHYQNSKGTVEFNIEEMEH